MPDVSATSDNLLDFILRSAIDYRASDVHLEPERDNFAVRFRVDGLLYPIKGLGSFPQQVITSRIKVVAEMDLFEHRLPQDGHFEFNYNEHRYNVRVSTSPTVYGQAVVLRIFGQDNLVLELASLGLEPEQLELVHAIIGSPYGMVLITGQIGSGKTSLLYSLLNELNTPQRNIITLEDPVEFQMPNMRQLQVNELVGLTFAKAMRAAVRQDPDVIMLGEIRDSDTAQISFQAALTGSLVFSTFHTFDVAGLVIRLIEMGVPRSVVAHALAGVVSTRLVRKICQACARPYKLSPTDAKVLGGRVNPDGLKQGAGCHDCHESGYKGRIGIYEVTPFDDEISSAIVEDQPASAIRDLLRRKVSITLRDAAILKVSQGVTTVNELVRVIGPHL